MSSFKGYAGRRLVGGDESEEEGSGAGGSAPPRFNSGRARSSRFEPLPFGSPAARHHDPFCLCFTCREKQGNTDEEGNEFGLNGPVSDGRREGVGGYHRRETSRGVHSSGSRHGILWRHRIPGVTRKRPALPLPSTLISDFTLWRGTHSHVLTV